MARILLVNLASLPMPGNTPIFPIGVRCVEDALRRVGHHVELMDFVERPAALRDLSWAAESWDVIGFAIRNIDPIDLACDGHVDEYARFVAGVRCALGEPSPLLVAGGPGFSLFAESLLGTLDLDVGVAGPGETAMTEIARNPERFRASRTVLNGDRYFGFGTRVLSHPVSLLRAYADVGDAMVGVETRRKTCFQKCVYCPYAHITGDNSGDQKPVDTLVAEIEHIHRSGFGRIFFTDSIFNAQLGHAKSVVRALVAASLRELSWSAYFSPKPFDDEIAELLKGSGLQSVVVSPDSLDDRVMRLLGKSFDVAAVERFINRCRRQGLRLVVNLVFGGPGETRESVTNTARFVNRMLGDDELAMHVGYRVLPQTALATQVGLASEELLYPTFYPFHNDLLKWIIEELDERFLTPATMMNLLAGRASSRRMVKVVPPGTAVSSTGESYVALSRRRA